MFGVVTAIVPNGPAFVYLQWLGTWDGSCGKYSYDPERPGFKHIILRPWPVGDLTFVRASHRSLYGLIVSDWKIDNRAFLWTIAVPPNTTAIVYVPAKDSTAVTEGGKPATTAPGVQFLKIEAGFAVYSVGSGTYSFRSAS